MSKHVPAGWQVKTLEECMNGKPEYGANASAIDYSRSLPRYIRITDITEDGYLSDEDIKSIPIKTGGKYYLDEGDFLFARTGASVGKTYLYKRKDGVAAFAGYLIRYRTNGEVLLPEYLFQYTHSSEYWNWVKGITRTGAQPNINAQEYASILLTLPPRREQQKLIKILSSADRSIAATEKLIAKLADLKKALMQQLLTKGIGHAEFKPSPLGPIPKNWEVVRLEDVTLMKSGEGITSKSIQDKGVYPVYGGNGLRGFAKTFTHTGEYVLIGRQGALCGNITRVGGKFYASEHAVVVTAKEQAQVDWIFYKLGYMNLNQYSEASAQPGLSVEKILRIKMALPPIVEQQKIAEVLVGIDRKLSAAKVKLAKAKDLKQGLMNDLLTGKVRVRA